jgi:hypothetical protein
MARKATPVLKKWLVHVARTAVDGAGGSATKRGGADIGRVEAVATPPTV